MIKEMTIHNLKDVNKPNQAFEIIGRIIPVFAEGVWSFTESLYEKAYEKRYPDDAVQWEEYIDNANQAIFFYYDNNDCVGQVRIRKNWNKYAFIEDIAVAKNYREKGIGAKLMQRAVEWAKENHLCGLMLETQDNNLKACRFYHRLGFQLGAVDTMLYANFGNSDENAVFWYLVF